MKLRPFFASNSSFLYSGVYKKEGRYERSWKKIELEYSRIFKIAKGIGAQLAIVYIPQKGGRLQDISYPANRLSDWCATNGVYFINTISSLMGDGRGDAYYWREGHCNQKGYNLIAEVVFTELVRRGRVPCRHY